MNPAKRIFCRAYQFAFHAALPLLPYREPEACLMVGNDAWEDLAAAGTGMRVFLLTDCLINPQGRDLSDCPHGGFSDLQAYLRTLAEE